MKAFYFNCKAITEAAVEAEILQSCTKEEREYILVCEYGLDSTPQWIWQDKDLFLNELMENEEGQALLLEALKEAKKELPKFYQPYKCKGCSAATFTEEGFHRCVKDFEDCNFL